MPLYLPTYLVPGCRILQNRGRGSKELCACVSVAPPFLQARLSAYVFVSSNKASDPRLRVLYSDHTAGLQSKPECPLQTE